MSNKWFIRVMEIKEDGLTSDSTLVTGNLAEVRKLALARFELEFPTVPYRSEGNSIHSTQGHSRWVDIKNAYDIAPLYSPNT